MTEQIAIGIDLGTTFSAMAFWDHNQSELVIIENQQGNRVTPSYVSFT